MLQALVEVIHVHKVDAKVTENAAGAVLAICYDGEWCLSMQIVAI